MPHGPIDDPRPLLASLVGRTIIKATMVDMNPGYAWTEHERFYLVLDDGRTIIFGGYGYDAWGGTLGEGSDEFR